MEMSLSSRHVFKSCYATCVFPMTTCIRSVVGDIKFSIQLSNCSLSHLIKYFIDYQKIKQQFFTTVFSLIFSFYLAQPLRLRRVVHDLRGILCDCDVNDVTFLQRCLEIKTVFTWTALQNMVAKSSMLSI